MSGEQKFFDSYKKAVTSALLMQEFLTLTARTCLVLFQLGTYGSQVALLNSILTREGTFPTSLPNAK